MYIEEITITHENLKELFNKTYLLLKSNINSHVFISNEIIEELQKNGRNYNIRMHNYCYKCFSTNPNNPILHFSLHRNSTRCEVISTISCIKFSKDYYLMIIFDNKDTKKLYKYDTVQLDKLVLVKFSK